MRCPNCGKNIRRTHCMFCGYILETGNFVDKNNKGESPLLEIYLGDKYNKIIRNDTPIQTFILGPLYISMKGFILYGLVLLFIDIFVLYCIFIFNSFFPVPMMGTLFNVIILAIERMIWMTVDNLIYIRLLNKKLIGILNDNPNNYKELIDESERNHSDFICLFITLFIIVMLIIAIFLIHVYIK